MIASESGHWYTADGEPMYEVEKADGSGLRPTTLRDARKLNLSPSVTTILKMMPAPQLEMWKIKQAVLQARTMWKRKHETDDQFAIRAHYEAQQQVRDAASIGTKIHGACENYFLGAINQLTMDYYADIDGVIKEMARNNLSTMPADWNTEKSFTHPSGFGGKVDLHNDSAVLDFKTKDFNEDKLPLAYENHALQLGAYRLGLGLGDVPGYICFVSHSQPGLSHLVKLEPAELDKGEEMFKCLLGLWQAQKGYVPDGA
jgi:hypothetical protein